MPHSVIAIWIIAICAAAGVVLRPFRWPEAVWAVAGALLLVALHLMTAKAALAAAGKGTDVYLFLAGMMILSEVARSEGLFDWLAARAVSAARGSARRLFLLIYGVGIGVTAILSNDATAVVLTPAVFSATTKARVDPLPYLFICALLAIGATYFALRWAERDRLGSSCDYAPEIPALTRGGRIAFAAIALTAVVLIAASAFGIALGLPTAIMGAATMAVVILTERSSPRLLLKQVSWSILPLVAGLFVLVEALSETGAMAALTHRLELFSAMSTARAAGATGIATALAANLMNNLPVGLIAGSAIAHQSRQIVDCALIGVDLGPNLSVSGSLATILWLTVIRREGEDVTFWRFLKVGALVMPPALLLALSSRLLLG